MMRLAFLAALVTISGPVLATPGPMGLPDFSIEKSCSLFAGHPRPLVLCQDTESRYRGESREFVGQTPVLEREACVKLASQSQRGKLRGARALSAHGYLGGRLERRRRIHQAIRD